MINLDTEGFENPEIALMECSCFIYNCFPTETRIIIKEDWERSGGIKKYAVVEVVYRALSCFI